MIRPDNFTAERAINHVANFPRTGQVDKGIFFSRVPFESGEQVEVVATWEGAAHLTGDPKAKFVSLGINPNLGEKGKLPTLKVIAERPVKAQTIFQRIEEIKP